MSIAGQNFVAAPNAIDTPDAMGRRLTQIRAGQHRNRRQQVDAEPDQSTDQERERRPVDGRRPAVARPQPDRDSAIDEAHH